MAQGVEMLERIDDLNERLHNCINIFQEIVEHLAKADETELREIQKRVRRHLAANSDLFQVA